MGENIMKVQEGFDILLPPFAKYICDAFYNAYRSDWWFEILDRLGDQSKNLPGNGTFKDLMALLDIAKCLRLLTNSWNELFDGQLPVNCRNWANELKGVRNITAHRGSEDMDLPTAERALNTMELLCRNIDTCAADKINVIYMYVRSLSDGVSITRSISFKDPAAEVRLNAVEPSSMNGLLALVGTSDVLKTSSTRKIAFGGNTVEYPVYRVRLDRLYYNDQNDRIATWINAYETENGADSLSGLDRDMYNRVIEDFVFESDPESNRRTQSNIELVGQLVPGVTLADGRIVDGNRRFTCLRRNQRQKDEPLYFDTAILDLDIEKDRKQIKLLELAVQHGEEKKVGYDLIDFALGTYRDVEETGLLTVGEYAASTMESVASVTKRIDTMKLIVEFLEHIKLPDRFHVAKYYQVYSIFQEMMTTLGSSKLDNDAKKCLKAIVFDNVFMKAVPDQKELTRSIKSIVRDNNYVLFFNEQKRICNEISDRLATASITDTDSLADFADANDDLRVRMAESFEKALQLCRIEHLRNQPSQVIGGCLNQLQGLELDVLKALDDETKADLTNQLDSISATIRKLKRKLNA